MRREYCLVRRATLWEITRARPWHEGGVVVLQPANEGGVAAVEEAGRKARAKGESEARKVVATGLKEVLATRKTEASIDAVVAESSKSTTCAPQWTRQWFAAQLKCRPARAWSLGLQQSLTRRRVF